MPLGGSDVVALVQTAEPVGVAVDGASVYLTTRAQGIVKVPIGGGSLETVSMYNGTLDGIAVAGGSLFFSSLTEIIERPLSGGSERVVVSGQDQIADIAVDADNIYFTHFNDVR